MKTSIIILTHNQLDITKQCLNSIRKHTPEAIELIIVDNNSTDGTVAYLQKQTDLKTIFNEKNLGFAKGCNQGFGVATGDNILFLNNDTVVTENWLGNMLRLLHSNAKIGLVGPVTNYISGPQQIPVTYKSLDGLELFAQNHCKWHAGSFTRVMRLVGFCLLIKREVLEEIGLFDERFGFGNYEDDDLCLRAAIQGWQLFIALDSFIHHIGSVTIFNCEDTKYRNLLEENSKVALDKWGFDIVSYLFNTPPDDPGILHNKSYLESVITKKEAIKKRLTFVTLFPETENVHLCKDVGMIPYVMSKHFELDAKVACYKNGDYPYADSLVQGLKLDFIPKATGDAFFDGIAYLNDNAQNIDVLNLYHLLDRTLEWARLYKTINPQGKVFLKLDTNEWYIKQFDINETNITGSHRILKECDLISVETKELHRYLNEEWPLSVKYLPNGFYDFGKSEKVKFEQKENIVCTVGRIGLYLKANEILLEAFKIAAPDIPDWKLRIIGPIEASFEGYITKFFLENPHLAERVVFTGEIEDKDVLASEYKRAKIFCMTSRLESFGLVFAEAASKGCFIITSDVVSANDVTDDGKYGDIFHKEDIYHLAQLLIKNCHDDERLARTCDEIQEYAYQNFYWVEICNSIYNLLVTD